MQNTMNHKPISGHFSGKKIIFQHNDHTYLAMRIKNWFKMPCYKVKLGLTGKYILCSNSGQLTRAVHSLMKVFCSWTVNKSGCAATPSGKHALLQRNVVFTVAG